MASLSKKVDKPFLFITSALVICGFLIFCSASLGLLAQGTGKFYAVMFNQLVLGLFGGVTAALIISHIHYSHWRKYAFYIFIACALLMILVFVPGIGVYHGGAHRWIGVGGFSVQPSELYKIGFVLYVAAWMASVKQKASTFKLGTLPFLIFVVITAGLVLMQPDTDTFMVIVAAGVGIFLTAGAKWRDLLIMLLIGILGLALLVTARPYLMKRIQTFMDPSKDPTGSGYQIQQSLIAIGSGGLFGRGFGQSIQKFNFLPEQISDSIFSVAAEEFGFVGSVFIIMLYLAFAYRGLRIAARAPDPFASYVVVGIIILIVTQSFLNIAAMLAIIPLSGNPLLFISHGGTALFFTLASTGIILNISRYQKRVVG